MLQIFLSALFGLMAGLVGTGFQAWLQKQERADERQERRRELKRAKAEQIFMELSDLVKAYSDLSIDSLRYANGRDEVTLTPASNAKVSALLQVYFPDLVPLLQVYDADMMNIVGKSVGALREDNAFKDPEKIKGILVIQSYESSQRTRRFSDELREQLTAEIQRLW